MSSYRLAVPTSFSGRSVALVGCGGTGSHVAEGLARLLLGYPGLRLVLVDGDRVEARNMRRQNFTAAEVGDFKARALATRLARELGTPIGYVPEMLAGKQAWWQSCQPLVVVGCVDNPLARQAIGAAVDGQRCWWVDAGNGETWGQVLVGNSGLKGLKASFRQAGGVCWAMPLPTLQAPGLLEAPQVAPEDLDCAEAVDLGGQSPTINAAMAALVLEVVHRYLERDLRWVQVYLDLANGVLRTVPAEPRTIKRITGMGLNALVSRRKEVESWLNPWG